MITTILGTVSSSASHLATGDVVELLPNSERISRAWIGKTVKVVQIVSEFAQVMVVDPETSLCEKTTWWRVDCMKRRSQLPMLPPELYSRILSFAIDVPKTNLDYWKVIFEVYKFHSWEIFLFEKLRKGKTPYLCKLDPHRTQSVQTLHAKSFRNGIGYCHKTHFVNGSNMSFDRQTF